jgi:hypothetical protein
VSVSGAGAIPDGIVLRHHLELQGRRREALVRRGLIGALVFIPLLALLNVFGQRPSTSSAENDAARLVVDAPPHLRGGLLFQARVRVTAKRDLAEAGLLLDPGWIEGMQVNSIEPAPVGEKSDDGRLLLGFGRVRAGETLDVRFQFQVDPTNVGRRSQSLKLEDSGVTVLGVTRTVTVFP